jgi:SAM-dependent methyltransferase
MDVLDVGCGHGEVSLTLAPRCHHILAYDRVESYIQMAKNAAQEEGVVNITYLHADSSPQANNEVAKIPAEADPFDLLISRRGPLHWIEDAKRVARQGVILIQLNPLETPIPIWAEKLPEPLRTASGIEYSHGMLNSVNYRLQKGGLELHSAWRYDVLEIFDDPQELYTRLSWGYLPTEVPAWEDGQPTIERIYQEYAWIEGLILRHTRLLWMAKVIKKFG